MKKSLVLYKSSYGHTQKYAQWISEKLNCELVDLAKNKKVDLSNYDTIIVGGGIYASGINGISVITSQWEQIKNKKIIVYTVGLSDPKMPEQFTEIINKAFTPEQQKQIKVFHLRGGINYKQLNIMHRSMMAMLKKFMLDKKSEHELTDQDREMLKSYGNKIDFTDISTIEPIIKYALSED